MQGDEDEGDEGEGFMTQVGTALALTEEESRALMAEESSQEYMSSPSPEIDEEAHIASPETDVEPATAFIPTMEKEEAVAAAISLTDSVTHVWDVWEARFHSSISISILILSLMLGMAIVWHHFHLAIPGPFDEWGTFKK